MKVLISGGGTGGHIFPALSIANALRRRMPDVEILFVGAEGRMEMERVPAAGYEIVGLPVSGFDRKRLWRNFRVLIRLWRSMRLAKKVLRDFRPDIAVGVGGYASGPMLKEAQKHGIPTLIQEQNSYAGVTNKLLAAKSAAICTAYPGMERFFPADKILLTGNPVRAAITEATAISREEACRELGLPADRPIVLVVGGSLGARTINEAIAASLDAAKKAGAFILWQTGKYYAEQCAAIARGHEDTVKAVPFISRMDLAYRAADLVVSRAGAGTISELQVLGKSAILIPSPNVAEDHQRKNAEALASRDAAVMILDADACRELPSTLTSLLADKEARERLGRNAAAMALRDADEKIVDRIIGIVSAESIQQKMSKKKIYFAGAGGIGMAALERYFLSKGYRVAGYDRTPSDLTRALQQEGVEITFDDSTEAIPADFKGCPADVTVVYTPALPDSHPQLAYFRANGYEVIKRAAMLGAITRDSKGLCFSGTHGKTTTSSMAAHLMHVSGIGSNAFLGGVLRGYGSNLMLSATSPYSVIEADEFDRSFHHLSPYVAVVTATDPDHLDIYGTEEAYLESFAHFTELIVSDGKLLIHTGLKLKPRPAPGVAVYTYSRDAGDFHAANIRRAEGHLTFDLVTPWRTIADIDLGVPVEINIENAIAAAGACLLTGEQISDDAIREAMATFQGAKRRFEFWFREPGRAIIDDYAHHPDELRASITSVKALYPGRKLTVAFQPHLYTRTRDFAPQFAEALSLADSVILLDIYPAREEPIEGVTSKIIFDRITTPDKVMISKENLTETIKNRNFEILLTAGAGDICASLPAIVDAVGSKS